MNRRYYDHIAGFYDDARYLIDVAARAAADVICDIAGLSPKSRFLEVGVGTASNVIPFVRAGMDVVGIDPSPPMLAMAQAKAAGLPNLTLLVAGGDSLPFSDARFDCVLTVHVLHAMADWRTCLNEIARVLRPDGNYVYGEYLLPRHRAEIDAAYRAIIGALAGKVLADSADRAAIPAPSLANVRGHLEARGWTVSERQVTEWAVAETAATLLSCYERRAFGSCWLAPKEVHQQAMTRLAAWCHRHLGGLDAELSSTVSYQALFARLPTNHRFD